MTYYIRTGNDINFNILNNTADIEVLIDGSLTLNQDLTVLGTTTTIDTTNLLVEDPIIVTGTGNTLDNTDLGMVMTRAAGNVALFWDESVDEFVLVETTADGSTSGDMVISSYSDLHVGGLTSGSFTSLGITDNATTTQITITDTEVTFENKIVIANSVLTDPDTFYLDALIATTPRLQFDSFDHIEYDRSTDQFIFTIGSQIEFTLNSTIADFLDNAITTTGDITGNILISTVTTGTAPLTIASTTLVSNLNADQLDGIEAAGFPNRTDTTADPTVNDDIDNYQIGSIWVNSTSDAIFINVDNTDGVAIWSELSIGGIPPADILLRDGSIALTSDWDAGAFDITAEQFHSDIVTGTSPFTVASTTVVTNLNADTVDSIEGAEILQRDGSIPLTADWDAGAFDITAEQFHSDIVTGTAPFTVASTTLVTNLNADQLDGIEAAGFPNRTDTTIDPTVNDDIDNYQIGSIWINTTDNGIFVCVDNTDTAAIWSEVASSSFTELSDDPSPQLGADLDLNGNALIDGTTEGLRLTENSSHILLDFELHASLTAGTTQTQAGGLQLLSSHNEVSTVANENDTVVLPVAVAGRVCTLLNNGANHMQIFPAVGDDLGKGVDIVMVLEINSAITFQAIDSTTWYQISSLQHIHGAMFDEDNTDAFVISSTLNFTSYHTNGLAEAHQQGWTFDAGGAGTSFPIASIADGVASGVDIEVTTTGSHGLAIDDIVSQSDLSDTAYEGIFQVKDIISVTQYEVEAVFTATDTGTMDQAAILEASVGSAGMYELHWNASLTSASANEIFDYKFYLNDTVIIGSSVRRSFGGIGDFGSVSSETPHFLVAEGDKVSFAIQNNDTAGDLTIRNLNVALTKI